MPLCIHGYTHSVISLPSSIERSHFLRNILLNLDFNLPLKVGGFGSEGWGKTWARSTIASRETASRLKTSGDMLGSLLKGDLEIAAAIVDGSAMTRVSKLGIDGIAFVLAALGGNDGLDTCSISRSFFISASTAGAALLPNVNIGILNDSSSEDMFSKEFQERRGWVVSKGQVKVT